MSWPSMAWWSKAHQAITKRAVERVRAEREARERSRVASVRNEEQAEITRRLLAFEEILTSVLRDGWWDGGARRAGRRGWRE